MLKTYDFPRFAYRRSAEQLHGAPVRHPVVIVGAGPVGLTAALDCASRGLRVVVLDDNDTVSVGSRALCYAKRTLEVWDRLGVADRLVDKGIQWKVGKVFREDRLIHEPNLADPDVFYEALIDAQRELDDAAAERFRARLLRVLANHVGDAAVLAEALRVARQGR